MAHIGMRQLLICQSVFVSPVFELAPVALGRLLRGHLQCRQSPKEPRKGQLHGNRAWCKLHIKKRSRGRCFTV